MKKIIYPILLMMATVLSSCDDYLEAPTKSSLRESVIFSDPELAKGAVDGIKVPMAETNSYRGRFLPWYGMNTDIEWYNSSDQDGDNADLAVYDAKPNNGNMNTVNNVWAMMYQSIERANLCIQGLRTYGNPEPGTELGYLLGEALTLRAVVYSDLLKAWGDVVARFEPIETATIYLPKTNRDEIYKQIIADLGEASELVPWPNETPATKSVERINKAFVKGLRARLALAASGYSQYPDAVRRSNDPELSVEKMYALAYQECLDVINSGTAILEPQFETVFKKNNQDNVAAGGETLWEMPFADGRGRMLFTFAVRHRTPDQYTDQARGGQAGPLPHVFYDYDSTDTRRNVSCVPYEWGEADRVTNIAKQELTELDTWAFGKYRYEWMNRKVTSTNDDGVNKLYMRYAEVVLMAAEIANELEGPAAAAPYLKQIRKRAFPADKWQQMVDEYVDALSTKDAMFNAIVDEHAFEFCGEMLRKQALIRWNLLKEKLDEALQKMKDLRNSAGEYANVPQTLYYKYAEDEESLIIYGLNRGEFDSPGPDYTSVTYISPDELTDDKINSLYKEGVDPDKRQFWPIWQVFLDGSNGMLANDYGY